MPLTSESQFGVQALTASINKAPAQPTQIRELGIFQPKYLTTTYAEVEYKEGKLGLVQSQPRGHDGESTAPADRKKHLIQIPHLPVHDIVRADDVQNVRAFGSTQTETVQAKIEEKLAAAKSDLEYTREHLMLGALQGKVLDADGTEMLDIYKTFGLTRKTFSLKLDAADDVRKTIDAVLSEQRTKFKGAAVTGWVAYCGAEFLAALKYHDSIKDLYARWQGDSEFKAQDGLNPIEFIHKGIKFIEYTGVFGTKADIGADKAILLPVGRDLYHEYFAPADMNETVNTIALPYYASREKLKHSKGWDLHSQSNPLPLALRPELVATLTAA